MSIERVYIKELEVDNYKSLKKSKVSFKDGLNIIIGKNGAGKSNLLEFIKKYIGANGLLDIRRETKKPYTGFDVVLEYLEESQIKMFGLAVGKTGNVNEYNLTIKKGDTPPQKLSIDRKLTFRIKEELNPFRVLRTNMIRFQLPRDINWLSKPINFTIDEQINLDDYSSYDLFANFEMKLESIAEELNGFNYLTNEVLKNEIINLLERHIEDINLNFILNAYSPIQKIRINPNVNIYSNNEIKLVDNLIVDFLIEGNWLPWSYLSDGTKRLFYILTEVICSNSKVFLIEEPELGIHPHQLFKLLHFLKEESREKQIIISTHSPMVLDMLNEDELDRIIIAKYEAGTKFYYLTEQQKKKAQEYIAEIGELSYFWMHSDLEE